MLSALPSRPAVTNRYVPALTGLRAVAAYAVFLHHYNPAPMGTFAHRLFSQSYVGVSVFFVLSGFLIHSRYAGDFLMQKKGAWRVYIQNRFARIFPLYALLLGMTVGGNWLRGQTVSGPGLGLNLTLLNGFFDDYKFSGIAQSWSLTVEVTFYLLAPFLFGFLRRWGAFRLAISLTSVGLGVWATIGQLGWHGLFGSAPFVLFYTFFGRAFDFMVGMWLAHRWHAGNLPPIRVAEFSGLVLMGLCVFWQTLIVDLTTQPTALFWSEVVVYNYLLPVGIGLFFLGLLRNDSVIRRVLAQPMAQMLGRGSYAFYLIHIGIVAKIVQQTGVVDNRWVLFGVLVLTAQVLYTWVEKPLQRRLRATG